LSRERTETVVRIVNRIGRTIVVLLCVVLAYWWLQFVLRQFPYSRPLGESLRERLIMRVSGLGLGIVSAIPDLIAVMLIVAGTRALIGVSNWFFAGVERGTLTVPWAAAATARATRRIVAVLAWAFALILAYPYLPGNNTDAFKGVSVFAGLIVSLGSAGIANQLMSGVTLIYSRAMTVGDFVQVGDVQGTVTVMNLLSIKIRTSLGQEVAIPNAVVVGQSTINYSALAPAGGVYLHTQVKVGYDAPWRQVRALLLQAAARTPQIRRMPAPRVIQRGLDDFAVRYSLVCCVNTPSDRTTALDELHANIQDAFNEQGIQIMTPAYEGDPARPKTVPKERWYPPPVDSPAA
jgi:small-conductance mechanosensitive channel